MNCKNEIDGQSKTSLKRNEKCFSITSIPKIFETKIREYPTLTLVKNELSNSSLLRYKERESPYSHVEEVLKNVSE